MNNKFEAFDLQKISLTKYLFFTGKGGVGKTSTACAVAVALADAGKNVLLISTDPASNLQDVFKTVLDGKGVPIDGSGRSSQRIQGIRDWPLSWEAAGKRHC